MKIKPLRTILLNNRKITLQDKFNMGPLEGISWAMERPFTHEEIAKKLKGKNPYTITIFIESLEKGEYWRKKEYVTFTKHPKQPLYRQLLFEEFYKEFGNQLRQGNKRNQWDSQANEVYSNLLDKYRPIWGKEGKKKEIDEYIIEREFEPRYKEKILKRFKNHRKLFRDRFSYDRQRRYNIPEPFSFIGVEGGYQNFFVWEDKGKKVATMGASGSSGRRETNSKFILGLLKLNKADPVPSYLYLYSGENKLLFIQKFNSLCVPALDVGSNYTIDYQEQKRLMQQGIFLDWDMLGTFSAVTASPYEKHRLLSKKRLEDEFKETRRRLKRAGLSL